MESQGFGIVTRLEIWCPSEGVLAGLRLLAAGKVPSRVPWQQLGMIWEVQRGVTGVSR